jgi:hypothetical protein
MSNIYQKLGKVMSQVNRVPKNGYNAFHKYAYATESDLTESIRPILLEAGLAFFSSVLEQEREGEFTKVKMEFILADIETGEKLTSTYWGEGQDKGDKGLYKAYTGATKYFLMKTFLIPTGDDPEGDTTADERNHNKKTQQPKQTANTGHYEPKKISTNQLKMLNSLITRMDKEKGLARERVIETLRKKDGIGQFDSTANLSVGQASKAIETLQTALGDK